MHLQDLKQINRRCNTMFEKTPQYPALPLDDPKRNLTIAQPDTDESLPHIGVVGDTYTITLTGDETNGRFCVIYMHVPPGGGPGPHRHDFEETFILLEGEVEATFRGKRSIVKAGDSINIPSNAPHQFHNGSSSAARLLCICSPAGSDNFFLELGVKVATRTTAPPKLPRRAGSPPKEVQGNHASLADGAAEGSLTDKGGWSCDPPIGGNHE
jgi:quercetin dioxygenase-like cupin family protein